MLSKLTSVRKFKFYFGADFIKRFFFYSQFNFFISFSINKIFNFYKIQLNLMLTYSTKKPVHLNKKL